MVLMKKFTVLPHQIRVFYHNPGEELRKLIQLMVSRTPNGNGLTVTARRNLWLKEVRETSVTKALMRQSTDLLPMIRVSSHNHGNVLRMPMLPMDPQVDSIGMSNQQRPL
jgi:hypothetical protein